LNKKTSIKMGKSNISGKQVLILIISITFLASTFMPHLIVAQRAGVHHANHGPSHGPGGGPGRHPGPHMHPHMHPHAQFNFSMVYTNGLFN
jgi:hypothetical protein